MKAIFVLSVFCVSFSINAERSPLTEQQLQNEADQVCSGTISDIKSKTKCLNLACTNYQISFTAEMTNASCRNGTKDVLYAQYFEMFYNEGDIPPGAGGHWPQPAIGEYGTMYLKNGEIVYPNGWVVE